MIPTTPEIINIIRKAHDLHPDWSVSEIAAQIGYSPLLIINALAWGERTEVLKHDQENDTIESKPLDPATDVEPYGAEIERLSHEVFTAVSNQNYLGQDIDEGLMYRWLNNVRPLSVEMIIDMLVAQNRIAKYDLADPEDKESVYTFLTLPENLDKKLGAKQFKNRPKVEDKE